MSNPEFETVPSIDKLNADLAEQKLQDFCLKLEMCVESTVKAYSATKPQKRFATLLSRILGETMRMTAHVNCNRFEDTKRFKFTASERTRFRKLKALLEEFEELTTPINPVDVFLEKYLDDKKDEYSYGDAQLWRLNQCIHLLNQFGIYEKYVAVSDTQRCFSASLDHNSGLIKECRNSWKRGTKFEKRSYAHLVQTIELADIFAKPRTEEGMMM